MKKKYLILFLFFVFCKLCISQSKFVLQKGNRDKISFKLISNLIVFPVEVNGVKLSFLLDTGVSKPIIFNFLNIAEGLKINNAEQIYLRGLGEGEPVEALKSKGNIFRIGKAINLNQDLYVIFDSSLNFAPQLGVPIHGIIGYDFLKDFIVEINYSNKYIKLHNPKDYKPRKCRKCQLFNLEFFNKKPYIDGFAIIEEKSLPLKLLIDSGKSDALWLFENDSKHISIPEKYFEDFLGRGLSGSVYGKRSKIKKLSFKNFELKDLNTAFPDSISIAYAKKFKERSGSLGGEILKRFNIIFDYPHSKITLRKSRYFNSPFYYNKSGIVLAHDGVRVVREIDKPKNTQAYGMENKSVSTTTVVLSNSYKFVLAPAFTIIELRKESPAEKAGLQLGDVILGINNKNVHTYSLQEAIQLFYGEDGKRIKLLVAREGVPMKFQFQLKSLLD